jgi:hypothetical protein
MLVDMSQYACRTLCDVSGTPQLIHTDLHKFPQVQNAAVFFVKEI